MEGIEEDTITHALILEENGKVIETWDEFPNAQLEYIKNKDGILIAIGGGPAVSDMIELANKKNIQKYLMDGPNGASTEKSNKYRKDSFKFVKELVTRMYERNPDIFKKGIIKLKEDGKTLDLSLLISEAEKEIDRTHKLNELNERFCYRALEREHDVNSVNEGKTIYCKPYYEENVLLKENYYSIDLSTHIADGSLISKYISCTKQIGIAKHKYAYDDYCKKIANILKEHLVEKFVIQEYYNNMYNMQTVANKFKEICIDNANISTEMMLKTLTGVKMQIVKKIMQNKKLQEKIEELKIFEMQKVGVKPHFTNYKDIINNSYEFTEGIISATSKKYDYTYSSGTSKNTFIPHGQNLAVAVKKDTQVYLPIGMEYDFEHSEMKPKYIVLEKETAEYPRLIRDYWNIIVIHSGNDIRFNAKNLKKYLISIKEQTLQQKEQEEAECDIELSNLESCLNIGD